ncbi:MAG: acylneuraminate cytidylyltransferase family protein [Bdellovibrionaceae bacterium]|nr:acylneuraminate cytidylyltransferase family protein [Pseudobdellovibrionaceae bacterium]
MSRPSVLVIIPARSGSKGIPHKNILDLNGHPLMAYSIVSALESSLVDRVVVSTDSESYAEIARRYGAEVPFLRPSQLAADESTDLEVFEHCLNNLKMNDGYSPDCVVLLRPTSPLRKRGLVDSAITSFYKSREASSLRSVVPSPITPLKMWTKQESFLTPAIAQTRIQDAHDRPRQELPQYWYQAGVVDIIKTTVIMSGSMSGNKIIYYDVAAEDYCDIDTEEDFQKAKRLILSDHFVKPKIEPNASIYG